MCSSTYTIEYKFFRDRELSYKMFEKREFDLTEIGAAHRWLKEMNGEKFKKNHIKKKDNFLLNGIKSLFLIPSKTGLLIPSFGTMTVSTLFKIKRCKNQKFTCKKN